MKRRHIVIPLLLAAQLLLLTAPLTAGDWIRRSALQFGERVRINVSGNNKIYYEASARDDVMIEITGPASMHIITRIELTDGRRSREYRYQWRLDEGDWLAVNHYTKPSEAATLQGAGEISVSRRDDLEVPEGTHRYSFRPAPGEERRIFFRITTRSRDPLRNAELTPLQPAVFGDVWQVIVGETNFDYYVARAGEDIVLDVVGPTTVKVISRLDYDALMMGDKSYRIKVHEDGRLKNTYAVHAKPSSVAFYEKQKGRLPSKGSTFFVSVPEGPHSYRFEFVDGDQTSLFRFYIPRTDLDQRR